MSIIKWYKRDPNAALGGMMGLTLEERGAYNTILDLIYAHDGNLPDDDRFICGWLKCDMRVWKRIKSRLLEMGKIGIESGVMTNMRASSEIDEALGRVASVSEASRIKGIKSGLARKKINGLNGTVTEPRSNTPTPTTRIEGKGPMGLEVKEGKMAGQFALDENSEAFKLWEQYRKATTGRGCPRTDIRQEGNHIMRGWYFPTEMPPPLPVKARVQRSLD